MERLPSMKIYHVYIISGDVLSESTSFNNKSTLGKPQKKVFFILARTLKRGDIGLFEARNKIPRKKVCH